jgi:hypothetical protein
MIIVGAVRNVVIRDPDPDRKILRSRFGAVRQAGVFRFPDLAFDREICREALLRL